MIKYYGGKKWLCKSLDIFLPMEHFDKVVDLFVGGGSVTDYFAKLGYNLVINDIDKNLITFYEQVKNNTEELIQYIEDNLKDLTFEQVTKFRVKLQFETDPIRIAYMYYCCVYSGYGGKCYQAPTRSNFNTLKKKNIRRHIEKIKKTLAHCEIMNKDYQSISLENCLYYCDPPYWEVSSNTYYGVDGKTHKDFDHLKFFNYISNIAKNNKVMISYEDSQTVRELYKGWNIINVPKQTSYFSPKGKKVKLKQTNELLITNYNMSFEGFITAVAPKMQFSALPKEYL